MSRIYFHSQHGDAEVSGAERGWMSHLCNQLLDLALGVDLSAWDEPHPLRRLLPPDHYVTRYQGAQFTSMLKTALHCDLKLRYQDEWIDSFTLSLNTAMACGGDALRLCARLHGQCEIHAYVEGPNRAWLAEIIEGGMESGILRRQVRDYPTGWESVTRLLRERDDAPVVTSYSVTDSFPNAGVAGWEGDGDAWYDLPEAEQWRRALDGLRDDVGYTLELKPENWATYHFGCGGVNGFQVAAFAQAEVPAAA